MPVYLSRGVTFVLNIKDHNGNKFLTLLFFLTNWVYFTTFLSNKSNQNQISKDNTFWGNSAPVGAHWCNEDTAKYCYNVILQPLTCPKSGSLCHIFVYSCYKMFWSLDEKVSTVTAFRGLFMIDRPHAQP